MLNTIKETIRSMIGLIVYQSGLYKILFGKKAIVLLFHRVDDSIADKRLTCSSKLFDEICLFAKKYFNVITLTELIEKLNNNQDISGDLVITFDDGYLDNYEVAAPILKKHGLSACFFIATDFIGTDHVTWWDKEDDIQSRWMNWDQVREMRKWGFEIAAHTKNHIDLGKTHGETALQEIKGSKDRLETELSENINLFCYPFGRKEQITEENRELVKELGFICCPSAYGGAVTADTDPYRMRRMSVDSGFYSKWDVALDILRQE